MNWSDRLSSVREFLDKHLFDVGETSVTFATLIGALAVFLVALAIASIVERALQRRLERKLGEDHRRAGALVRLVYYGLVILGLVVAVDTVGIDVRALFAAGAVFALAISFGLQTLIQNFVAGVVLLIEGVISPGDILHVEDRMVRVIRLGLRSTHVRTRDEEEIILPNTVLVQSSVINYTLSDRLYRVRSPVGVAYATDLDRAIEVLIEVGRAAEGVESLPEPRILVQEFGESSIELELNVWIRDPWDTPIIKSRLRLETWRALRDNGITIAFPQMDVHLDAPVVEALERSA